MNPLQNTRVLGALALLLTVAAVAFIALRSNDSPGKTIETAGAAKEAQEPGTAGRTVGEPSPGGAVTEEAPPALAFIDPDGPSIPGNNLPEGPSFGESTTSVSDDDGETTELPWDDADAAAATTTSRPIRASESATTVDTDQAAIDPLVVRPTPTNPPETTDTTATPAETTPTTRPATTTTATTGSTASPTTTRRAAATTTTTSTTTTTTTTTQAPPTPQGTRGAAGYIAPTAGTSIPVYDTAWQMLVRSTPAQADNYFAALKANGFSGTWTGVIHHAPATYNLNFAGGGAVGRLENGNVVLTDEYIAHARQILDAADRHGMKVGLVAAWQNLYLPGGGADSGVASSDAVRGTITTANAHAYGLQIADAFGDHPAVSMWVFGGDAGTNNTEANKAVWREMARGVRDTGSALSITYHTPTSEFGQLNYAGEPWLDFISPETGHIQDAATTESELRTAREAYGLPVWQGEPRYFNINFDWVDAAFRNPGVDEVRSDAQAAENAGVSGYVYGDAGRWTWCAGHGDSTPCSPNNVAASFGAGEAAVIEVFRN